jgi:hypothetical protein
MYEQLCYQCPLPAGKMYMLYKYALHTAQMEQSVVMRCTGRVYSYCVEWPHCIAVVSITLADSALRLHACKMPQLLLVAKSMHRCMPLLVTQE